MGLYQKSIHWWSSLIFYAFALASRGLYVVNVPRGWYDIYNIGGKIWTKHIKWVSELVKTNWKNQEASELESYFSYSEFVRRTALIEATRIIKENNEGENTYEYN